MIIVYHITHTHCIPNIVIAKNFKPNQKQIHIVVNENIMSVLKHLNISYMTIICLRHDSRRDSKCIKNQKRVRHI